MKTSDRTRTTVASPAVRYRQPSHEEIGKLAYKLYARRGLVHGYDQEDWFAAERALTPYYVPYPALR